MKRSLFILLKCKIWLGDLSQPIFYGIIYKTSIIKNTLIHYYNLTFMFLLNNKTNLLVAATAQCKSHFNYSPKI
jgi:hypothetical protein